MHAIRHRPPSSSQARAAIPADWPAIRPFADRPRHRPGPAGTTTAPGQVLPRVVAEPMGTSFGHDLTQVRIHEAPEAAGLGASALTHGKELQLAPATIRPENHQGPGHGGGCGVASRRGDAPPRAGAAGFARSLAAATARRSAALPRAGSAPVVQLCPQCGNNKCKHGSVCNKLQHIPSRGNVNPTKRTKATANLDEPNKFDDTVRPLVKKFIASKGCNIKTVHSTQVDMCHRLSDKGIRRIFDDVVDETVKNSKLRRKLAQKDREKRLKHLDSVHEALWDPSLQTTRQNKIVDKSRKNLTRLIEEGGQLSSKGLSEIIAAIKELSRSSRRNLRAGRHSINVKISEAPDLVAFLAGKRKGSLSPVSDHIASMLDEHAGIYKKKHVETTLPDELRKRNKPKKNQSLYEAMKNYTHSGGTLR